MQPDAVVEILSHGSRMGCTEALFTFGERPGLEKGFDRYIRSIGYEDVLHYCYDMCVEAIRKGLLPHTNAGILTYEEMDRLREVNASMGLMLETTAEIPAHKNSPGKDPAVRIEMIENAGRLRIPFTTGLLIGIGETEGDHVESLETIRDIHRRYGHIQEVIIQNFCPKEGTSMEFATSPGREEFCTVIQMAREILQKDIAVQIPPNLADARHLIQCGVDDLGGVSPLTIDYVNPEHPWPQIEELKNLVGDAQLKERLCIYPQYIARRWYHPNIEALIKHLEQEIQERSV
jgi:FO synthase subunit 1